MLQKQNNYYSLIEAIRLEPKHIRKISKELNLIPSTVMRLLNNLQKDNIVDFKEEGKNKIYFLKDSLEKKIFLFQTEYQKQINLLQNPTLRKIIKELIKQTSGELIILFGSYAKGLEKQSSDIDIYIETKNISLKNKLNNISQKLSIQIGNFDKESELAKEILKNHIIIQNVERFYKLIK